MPSETVSIVTNPTITPDQLFTFYADNGIWEQELGKEVAARVLHGSDLIIGAFEGDRLVGITRALFDGVHAHIVEFALALAYQGQGTGLRFDNGSIIEHDPYGLATRMGETLIGELVAMGALFISVATLEEVEESFYRSLGFRLNPGSLDYIIDRRPRPAASP